MLRARQIIATPHAISYYHRRHYHHVIFPTQDHHHHYLFHAATPLSRHAVYYHLRRHFITLRHDTIFPRLFDATS